MTEKHQKDRDDVRNTLEEYIYEMRRKLAKEGLLAPYVKEADRQSICLRLIDIEKWLCQNCDDCDIQQYNKRLMELQIHIDPIKARSIERKQQSTAFEALRDTIQMAREAITEYHKGSVKYVHLTKTEIRNLSEEAEKEQKWINEKIEIVNEFPKTEDLPFTHSDILEQQNTLTAFMNSVLYKPKPPTPLAYEAQEETSISVKGIYI